MACKSETFLYPTFAGLHIKLETQSNPYKYNPMPGSTAFTQSMLSTMVLDIAVFWCAADLLCLCTSSLCVCFQQAGFSFATFFTQQQLPTNLWAGFPLQLNVMNSLAGCLISAEFCTKTPASFAELLWLTALVLLCIENGILVC